MSNDTVVCSGAEKKTQKLKQYSLLTGDLLCCINMEKTAGWKAEVTIAGRSALAMSLGYTLCSLVLCLYNCGLCIFVFLLLKPGNNP